MLFQDVDVEPAPDEKSVMTYVAQFLHRYPEGAEGKVGAKLFFLHTVPKHFLVCLHNCGQSGNSWSS